MNVKLILDSYLGKNTRHTEKDLGDGSKQVCDLDTGECYVVRMKDGLIERVDNTLKKNNKPRNNYRLISQETDSIPTRTIETNETPNNKKVLKMIKKVKSKLCQETSK